MPPRAGRGRPIDHEAAGVIHGRFHAEDVTQLVIHLQGVFMDPVFHADAFDPSLHARGHLAGVGRVRVAEEAQNVARVELAIGMIDECGVERLQAGSRNSTSVAYSLSSRLQ